MSILTIALLFFAGFVSGSINAVAGGGTFISFGAFTLIGVPPIMANASSSIAQLPGYFTSTLPYLKDLKTLWRGLVVLSIVSVIGSLLGALLLLWLDNDRFRALVPWLLLAATLLFAAGPWLKPRPKHEETARQGRNISGPLLQFVTSIYGGFFGAGMGIMMLATLGLTESGDYHRLNAIKNVLANVIAIVAIVVFVSGGVVNWPGALAMAPGIALGGYCGVWIAQRVPQIAVRIFVIAFGLFLAGYYFLAG
ncbi:sulfite exporter TauE/SafE family protein [Fulvimarina sp. 2208YS6-2-32]|uniref:Probable membrane transporter protein n=1 Tax=Fulvimarina uroteuthidis TaxID=3098149 RepID=A0ABU5I107_9HYPH|nr:sulfite exporter TauE/SafE family protein [Fulvimarina sp. 2208YS6-2-32]MDY8109066.1 sulfite exporter TauE/SafE family protein [Fulvimarina sp. 2208YS6-2-32]